jgi:DNA invertase Pin-like site-specific DNA recombinase
MNLVQDRPVKYGYARIAAVGQSVTARVTQLRTAGCGQVFREVASGAKSDRGAPRCTLDQLDAGDGLMVTRLGGLARSTRDLLNTLAAITDRGAGFCFLKCTWAGTTTQHGRLMLTVLGGLAEFERDLIPARTSEGRARAAARGVKLGPKRKVTPPQQREAIKRRDRGDQTLREIASSYNVSHRTISRLAP